jgi:hypothetical protein
MTPSYLTLARREVVAASDLSGTPNQPGGYTAILDQPLNALAFTDAGVTWLNGGGWPTPDNGSVVSWVGAVANPYWGGNAGVATQAFSLDLDNITISGVPE